MRLRIATYNVHKCRGLDRRTDPERIATVIRELDADVIAMQEILDVRDGHPGHDQARRIATNLQEYEWRFGENRSLHGGAYGNMTLSRLPITASENYDITWRHRERRGCLRTDVSLTDRSVLHLFNLHLGTSFVERRHQARKLLTEAVLRRAEFTGPRIVLGDFNEWTRGLASRLMGTEFEAIEPRTHLRYARTYPGVMPLLHLDHFYFDRTLSLESYCIHRSRTALIASDHLPLVSEFSLAERTKQ
ncbi:Endonuclease/exonuclease/phosphatase [Candidatus Koribacter versatilis Ellin345]|uniref:Endonuclease/exonuclease/phosphatase n=1 Tax=Koribacter versatilis (strain Ellin345) TaxID=204669 RepID=Q1IUE9_KORVE|nr:endonuclease/exonuclease/phosphatase family protein [Candidatus Koribacter versatilis]ABF39501.1 Endonuclease/exonuclease/phosphatase [Candidatus Koribacter versatilis Ellin345]